MNILAIVPARGGSKRVPQKNKKILLDKPLICWTLDIASMIPCIKLIVSTDDDEIAEIARKSEIDVPYIRPTELASDTATMVDVVLDLLSFYEAVGENFDAVMLLQPTSPFRSFESIQKALSLYKENGEDSIVSVSIAKSHPYWCKTIVNGTLQPYDKGIDFSKMRSQDLPEIYQLNGLLYLSSVQNLKEKNSFYSKNTLALAIESEEESIDIDTEFDWLVAEAVAKKRGKV